MIITKENINDLPLDIKEKRLLFALLKDLKEINSYRSKDNPLQINWQDYHDEYSPERTDPCPDYYGYYTIKDINHPGEIVGVEMNIHELDSSICLICNLYELEKS